MSAINECAADPIAIVGIGCRFPGRVENPTDFWRLISQGVDAVGDVPPDRFDIDQIYDPRPKAPGKVVTRRGGFLQDVDRFDPAAFGISPREAARMDPQQRLLLEVAWEALEDGGQVQARLVGSSTGVYLGVCYGDFEDLQFERSASLDVYSLTGSFRSVAAGRISYAFDFQGPSLTVDAACASSGTAIHLACQALSMGDCDLALAGGVNLILHPQVSIGFSRAGMLSADGRCKFGDARADGFVRSEGVGLVLLKPWSRAREEGDPVYALIRGSAANDDGRSSGFLMTPGRGGQEAVIRKAWQRSGLSPGQAQYVEAHGTGTRAGDPVEMEALGAVLQEGRPPDEPCAVGSVKTNFGHTEGAAGVAGVIKTALSLAHRELPPSLHCEQLNPETPWDRLGLKVQRQRGEWPRPDRRLVAGATSLGISGSNVHLVMTSADEEGPDRQTLASPRQGEDLGRFRMLPLSAHNPATLQARAEQFVELLAAEGPTPTPSLTDLCFTLGTRRGHLGHRLVAVGSSRLEMRQALEHFLQDREAPNLLQGRAGADRKVVFVFPGQGSQWLGMGRQLLARERVFRDAIERCERAMAPEVDWSLVEQLQASPEQTRLSEIGVVQPALFAMEVALAELWRSWGVEPAAVIGHSMGEVAATHVAGALSLEDAMRVICRRSRLLQPTSGQGAMAVVELSLEEAQALVGSHSQVSVAVSNSPTSTVLSGAPDVVEEILQELEAREVFCRLVKVDVASHSPQMDPLKAPLEEALEELEPRKGSIPIASTVTGETIDGSICDAGYWMWNLRRPVLFSRMIDRLSDDGCNVFLEMSPHPLLVGAVKECLQHARREGVVAGSLRREEDEEKSLWLSFATLHAAGVELDWRALDHGNAEVVRLPTYPWQRQSLGLKGAAEGASRSVRRPGDHPLLGQYRKLAHRPGEHVWETELDLVASGFLLDHRVQGEAVLPGAAVAEMALEAGRRVADGAAVDLQDLEFHQTLTLAGATQEAPRLQVILAEVGDEAELRVFGRSGSEEAWTRLAVGRVRFHRGRPDESEESPVDPDELRDGASETRASNEFYRHWVERGNDWGPAFRGLDRLWRRDGEVLARLAIPGSVAPELGLYRIHPAVLDACLQALAATLPKEDGGLVVISGIGRLRVREPGDEIRWSHAQLTGASEDGTFEGRIVALDAEGRTRVEMDRVGLKVLARRPRRRMGREPSRWLYALRWEPAEGLDASSRTAEGHWVLVHGNGEGPRGSGVAAEVAEALRRRGGEVYEIPPPRGSGSEAEWMERLHGMLAEAKSLRGVVHLGSLDLGPGVDDETLHLEEALDRTVLVLPSLLRSVERAVDTGDLTEPPALWLVTRGAQAPEPETDGAVDPLQGLLWGLGRVVVNERPDLPCRRIDLPVDAGAGIVEALVGELLAADDEDEVALRAAGRFVHRLETAEPPASKVVETPAGDGDFRLEAGDGGSIEDLVARPFVPPPPGPGDVEIEVRGAALNFRDVLKVLGTYPGLEGAKPRLGDECHGVVRSVGEGVAALRPGDRVVAIAPGTFATRVTADARLTAPVPPGLTGDEAVTVPVAFLTAHYALNVLGRLRAGESVLVHSAAGGVGMAAIQLARCAGAEIFATAGRPEKRALLRDLGVQGVFDSRTLDFAREVREATGGEGVDVVLNSLAGEAMRRSLGLLRPSGRFLELGKTDIYRDEALGLSAFKRNVAYFGIDLADLFDRQPEVTGRLLRDVLARFGEDGDLQSLSARVFPVSQAREAFRHMARARHTGKVLLSFADRQDVRLRQSPGACFAADPGVQVIAGGLGGLGLELARWLVRRGARRLLLLGRREPSAAATRVLEELGSRGARIDVARVDVTDRGGLEAVLAESRSDQGPVTGVFHLAGRLDDGVLGRLNRQQFLSVARPKVLGAWNLHVLTRQDPLERFVLFSSAAGVLGSPGQGNYAAANAFLDALAHHRCGRGRPALSIDWGTWAEVGMAARPDRGSRLARRGLEEMPPEAALQVLGELLTGDSPQVAVMPIEWARFRESFPIAEGSPVFSRLVAVPAGPTDEDSDDPLSELPVEERSSRVESTFRNALGALLGIDVAALDENESMVRQGLDSLSAVELRNRLQSDLGVTLPVVRFLDDRSGSLRRLVDELLAELGTTEAEARVGEALDVDELTDEQVEEMLDRLGVEEVD